MKSIVLGERVVGHGYPTYIIAELGINHNGDIDVAKRLIDAAVLAGCDAVKFQKRTPELCVPESQRDVMRETPWGNMTYMDYRRRIEFGKQEYDEIDRYCRERRLTWFASCWDEPSVDFIEAYEPVCYKVASASLTDDGLLQHTNRTGRPVLLSTGMSTLDEIRRAVSFLDKERLILLHCNSTYPCPTTDLNLRTIATLGAEFDVITGYSGHEVGLQTTYATVLLGACVIERHLTLDRASWGSDQAASVEPSGFARLVRDIRTLEGALGDGVKRVYAGEMRLMERLRKNIGTTTAS